MTDIGLLWMTAVIFGFAFAKGVDKIAAQLSRIADALEQT